MTSYYWGFNEEAPDYSNTKNPWMGYRFEMVEAKGLDAYKIKGWQDSEKTIIANEKSKRLPLGTYIIFSTKAWNQEIRNEKMITAKKLQAFLMQHNITI